MGEYHSGGIRGGYRGVDKASEALYCALAMFRAQEERAAQDVR
jgi:hypothetical protein